MSLWLHINRKDSLSNLLRLFDSFVRITGETSVAQLLPLVGVSVCRVSVDALTFELLETCLTISMQGNLSINYKEGFVPREDELSSSASLTT
jgi:hypothetical protein